MTEDVDTARRRSKSSQAVPHSIKAEEAILGAALLASSAARILDTELDPGDFYRPSHGHIADAICHLFTIGSHIDPVTVANRLEELGLLESSGGLEFLINLQANAPATSSGPTYAKTIRDLAARRAIMSISVEASLRAADRSTDLEDVVGFVVDAVSHVDRPPVEGTPDRNIAEFLDEKLDYRWLVPGLLERGDRVMITGAEGQGKSFLLKQFAVQFAAGLHPFYPTESFEPIRTLIIDIENSQMQVHRALTRLHNLVVDPYAQIELGVSPPEPFDPDRVRVQVRPQGIDLLKRSDRRWFTERVAANRPDLIVTGPIYKMHRGKPTDEEPAAEVAGYLDEIRTAFDCALVLEAHSPHGNDGGKHRTLRPFGASLWMRWPEFGYGIRRVEDDAQQYEWVSWRGARDDQRSWPSRIKRGRKWPWVNAYDPEEAPF